MKHISSDRWEELPKEIKCPECNSTLTLGGCMYICESGCGGPYYTNNNKMGCRECLNSSIEREAVLDVKTLKPLKKYRKNWRYL